jgi:AraC family transcriptional regulator
MDGGNGGSSHGYTRGAKPIRVEFDRLTLNGKLARGEDRAWSADRAMRVLVASGRGCVLQGNTLPPMVLIPLRGNVRVADGETARMLRPGQLIVAEAGTTLQAVGSGPALWIALFAPSFIWRHLFDACADTPVPEPLLLPAIHDADRAIRRAAVRIARDARRAPNGSIDGGAMLLRFGALLAGLQSTFDPLIKRCPGRTLSQRRAVFLRLKRVYNCMEANSGVDLGIAGFARVANYSPCHFVRTFNTVYGETPHAVLMEQRLKRAMRLVNETELSITEVARASGFEDRCAFARSFKRRFGTTASALRGDEQDLESEESLAYAM